MKLLKMFGICASIVPILIVVGSLCVRTYFPIDSLLVLTVMSAVPMFIAVTLLKGLLKLLNIVWR